MINLTAIQITLLDGTTDTIDISKEFAQVVFQNTTEISEHDLAITLYREGEVKDTEDNRKVLLKYAKQFKAFAQIGINNELLKNVK